MFSLMTGLAMAYCVCTAPRSVEHYALRVGTTTDAVSGYEVVEPSGSIAWCGLNKNAAFDRTVLSPSRQWPDVYRFLWEVPRLQFWPATSANVPLGPEEDASSTYSLDFDGCTCAHPTDPQPRLSLALIPLPSIIAPNEDGEVPPQLTAIDGERAARELRRAWVTVVGRRPTNETVLVLAAQWAHETSGGQFMYNYNFGGIKGRGSGGLSCLREAHEGWGWRTSTSVDRFRAYRSAGEGAEDYVSLLARKYPAAIDAARSGDILQFVRALREGGYFTGNEAAYALSLIELAERAQRAGYNALRMVRAQSRAATNTSSRIALR